MVPVKKPRLLVLVSVDEPHAPDLRRRGRSAGLRPDREVRPAVPLGAARRARCISRRGHPGSASAFDGSDSTSGSPARALRRDPRPRLRRARRSRRGRSSSASRGEHVDGHDLAGEAVGARRRRLWSSSGRSTCRVPQLVVPSVRARDGAGGGAVLRRPVRTSSTVAAVTGTNGKTTTAFLLALDPRRPPAAGPALLTNIERRVGGELQADRAEHAGGDRPAAALPRRCSTPATDRA